MGNARSNFGVKLLEHKTGRQINVQGMAYAPSNEQGVVFLFGRLASKLGFCVESVQVHCPDCRARRKGKLHKIEFEYYASHFEDHRHDPKSVDIIVCWENDWESRAKKYRHLEIIDLKRYCGKGKFQSARDISSDWPQFYDKIVEFNPGSSAALKSYCRD